MKHPIAGAVPLAVRAGKPGRALGQCARGFNGGPETGDRNG